MREVWRKCYLGDALEFQRGYDLPSSDRIAGIFPIVSSSGITDFHNIYKVKGPGVVTGRYGTIGEVFYIDGDFWPLNTALFVKDFKGNCPRFISYYLRIIGLKEFNAAGAVPGINRNHLHKKKIQIPSLPTQCKIARILSAYDDLIENNLKRIKLLEEKAQLTFEEWFVKMRFPGYETAKFDEVTGLPEGWEIKKVGNLLSKVNSTKKIKSSEIQSKGNIPVIDQSRDFIAGYTNDPESVIAHIQPLIVFGDHTRILKFINFSFARGADGTQLILSNSKRMPQHLFYQVLLGIDLSNYHYARHFKFLKDCEIVLPTNFAANEYENVAKPIFDSINNLRNQNQLLKEARDILLPRLMSGMIDVEELEKPTVEANPLKAVFA